MAKSYVISPSRGGLRGVVVFELATRTFVVSDVGVLQETATPASVGTVTGIASTLTLGTHTLSPGVANIDVTGKASTLAFGTHTLVPGGLVLSVTGIASTLTLGVHTLARIVTYQYPNPLGHNPFFTRYPMVLTIRYVRVISGIGVTVVEDANTLPRLLYRVRNTRVFPQQTQRRTTARNIPDNDQLKGEW